MPVKSECGSPHSRGLVSCCVGGVPDASELDLRQSSGGAGGFRGGRSGRRMVATLLAMMLSAAMISVLPGAAPASADGAPPDSAMTKSGMGEFKNLQVTVSQTKNLINQAVTVTWKGGAPTTPATGAFGANFLQIMQCWGDDPAGPDRSQCQFGAANTKPIHGAWVPSSAGHHQRGRPEGDPHKPVGAAFVPFWPVGHPQPTGPGEVTKMTSSTHRSPTRSRWPVPMPMARDKRTSRSRPCSRLPGWAVVIRSLRAVSPKAGPVGW